MADKLFKKSFMGGYNKKAVEAKIAELTAALAESNEKAEALTIKLEEQTEKIKSLETERAFISDALLTAKKEGERMLEETQQKIAKLQTEAQTELDRLYALAEEERERIRGYQQSASEALKAYKEHIDNISI